MRITFTNLYESYHPSFIDNLYKVTMLYINNGLNDLFFSDEVYDLLTKDHGWEQQKATLSADDWKIYQSYIKSYDETNKKLIDYAKSKGWKNSGHSWSYFIKDEGKNPPAFQRKIYLTLSKKRSDFNKNMSSLFKFVDLFDQSSLVGRKHFKIGRTYLLFMNHLDNMVIYSDTEEDLETIDDIIKNVDFALTDRESVGRVSRGVDIGRKSDTQIIADNFVQYIKFNKDRIKNTTKTVDEIKQNLSNIVKSLMTNSHHRNIGK